MADEKDIYLKDLELQWQDHFHMRDQTWKTITNSSLILVALVGMEIKNIDPFIMILTSLALLLSSVFGFAVAVHHRLRQNEKFDYINKYEKLLKLQDPDIKGNIMNKYKLMEFTWYDPRRIANKINTVDFIKYLHLIIILVSILFLLKSIGILIK